MPCYKTIVEGQNFTFDVDNEPQYINFYKTLYINAINESEAEGVAINHVKNVLDDCNINFNDSAGYETLLIDEIEQIEGQDNNYEDDSDLIWFFPDDDF